MTGQAHWIDPLVMLVGGLGVLFLVLLAARVPPLLRRRARRLTCPVSGKRVDCMLVEDTLTKEWVDVVRCSAFGDGKVNCDKNCLDPRVTSRSRPSRENFA